MKKKWIAWILIQILILVGFGIWQWNSERKEYIIDGAALSSEIGVKTENGYWIDASSPDILEGNEWNEERQAFWFAKGVVPLVERGSYEVTVNYYTDTEGNQIEVQNWISPLLLTADPLLLSSQSNQMKTTIWLEASLKELEIRAFYKGEGNLEIGSISLIETRDKIGQDLVRILSVFLMIDGIIFAKSYWRRHSSDTKEGRQQRWIALILTGTVVMLCLPLTKDSLISPNLQDLDYHLARIVGMKSALREGQFPIRIHSCLNWGFGYASPMFYPELFLYPSAILHAIGLPLMQSYKAFVILMNIMTVLISYWAIKRMFQSRYIGLLGSMMYSLAYYRLVNVYLRAAVGEAMAMAFFPLIVYGLYQIYTMDTKETSYRFVWIVPALGYSGLIQSHIISCEMIGVFTIIVCILLLRSTLEPKRFFALCKTAIAAIILNLWFLLPMLQGMSSMGVPLYAMKKDTNWIQPEGVNLWNLFHLFAVQLDEPKNYLGLGAIFTVVFFGFLIIIMIWKKKEKNTPYYRLGKWFFGLGTLAVIFTLKLFPWDLIREMGTVGEMLTKFRLPSRYLFLATGFFTFLGCCVLLLILKKRPMWKKPMFILTAAASILCAAQFLDILNVTSPTIQPYSGANQITADWKNVGWGGEYLPQAMDGIESIQPMRDWESQPAVISYEKSGSQIVLQAANSSAETVSVQMPLIYYLGYDAETADGQPISVYGGEQGILTVDIPAGFEGSIGIWHRGFWYWDMAVMISFVAWIGVGILIYRSKKNL